MEGLILKCWRLGSYRSGPSLKQRKHWQVQTSPAFWLLQHGQCVRLKLKKQHINSNSLPDCWWLHHVHHSSYLKVFIGPQLLETTTLRLSTRCRRHAELWRHEGIGPWPDQNVRPCAIWGATSQTWAGPSSLLFFFIFFRPLIFIFLIKNICSILITPKSSWDFHNHTTSSTCFIHFPNFFHPKTSNPKRLQNHRAQRQRRQAAAVGHCAAGAFGFGQEAAQTSQSGLLELLWVVFFCKGPWTSLVWSKLVYYSLLSVYDLIKKIGCRML